jgi:hypothetical protein
MPLTFVTAFMELNEPFQREGYKDQLLSNFKRIADTGIQIHVFLSPGLVEAFQQVVASRNTLRITPLSFDSLKICQWLEGQHLQLPAVRSPNKDTRNYMILMNAKAECIYRSIALNPFQSSHYAWIDFGIGHVFRDWPACLKQLEYISNADFQDTCLAFPGCWESGRDIENTFLRINWRFCGGFFIGGSESLINLYQLYCQHFISIVKTHGLTWEVNVWHWLEHHHGWKPTWYAADHNDSILQIPNLILKKQERESSQELQ